MGLENNVPRSFVASCLPEKELVYEDDLAVVFEK